MFEYSQAPESTIQKRGRKPLYDKSTNHFCPCGKEYRSYSALWLHVRNKHDGKAPGKIIKPIVKRGRPLKEQNQQGRLSQALLRSNYNGYVPQGLAMKYFCDVIRDEPENSHEIYYKIKQIYLQDEIYQAYLAFDPTNITSNYNQVDDLFEVSCQTAICQFLLHAMNNLETNFHRAIAITFAVMISRGIKILNNNQYTLQTDPATNFGEYANGIFINVYFKMLKLEPLSNLQSFKEESITRMMEMFFLWLSYMKLSALTIRTNYKYF